MTSRDTESHTWNEEHSEDVFGFWDEGGLFVDVAAAGASEVKGDTSGFSVVENHSVLMAGSLVALGVGALSVVVASDVVATVAVADIMEAIHDSGTKFRAHFITASPAGKFVGTLVAPVALADSDLAVKTEVTLSRDSNCGNVNRATYRSR